MTIIKYNAIIIERKTNRFWDKSILDRIEKIVKNNQNIKYNGIKILDLLNFKEQIELFSKNNFFIFRHGSCLTNLLWIPKNSIIFDIDIHNNRKNIVRRVAKLTASNVISLDYNNIDYSKITI